MSLDDVLDNLTDPYLAGYISGLQEENRHLRETIAAIKAKIEEAMGECGTSSTTHHLLRAALTIGGLGERAEDG